MKLNIKSPIHVNVAIDEEAKKAVIEKKDQTVAWGKLMGRKFSAALTSIKETK